jgi:small nuclear ribonucleoprotein (snRNP)-like protein
LGSQWYVLLLSLHLCARLSLTSARAQLIELKNGDTYNGNLVNCDSWMNINLRDVICTSKVRRVRMSASYGFKHRARLLAVLAGW